MGIKGIENLVGDPVPVKVGIPKQKISKNIQTVSKSKGGKRKKK